MYTDQNCITTKLKEDYGKFIKLYMFYSLHQTSTLNISKAGYVSMYTKKKAEKLKHELS